MVNYENGKIYKLYSKLENITYIGSTAHYYLSQRLVKHKSDYKQYLKNNANYVTSFKILECEDYKIELLENYPCANIDQLETRERYYIENNECVNKVIPTRTQAEWREANKEYLKDYNKEYREVNKEHIKVHNSEKITCQCGCEITRNVLSRHKKSKKHLDLVQNLKL